MENGKPFALRDWATLDDATKRELIRVTLRNNRHLGWYRDFEAYAIRPDTLRLIDEFIRWTRFYLSTHHRFGAKAIIEVLRWQSHARDCDAQFKINNNFTTDITRLVKALFPSELDAFFESRKPTAGVAA